MVELKFDKTKCVKCKTVNCLVKCQYIDISKEKAKIEWQKVINGEDSFILEKCTTCYACEEYCPFNNHPFYLIVERQEEKGVVPIPRPLTKQWVNMLSPQGKPQIGKVGKQALSFCFMPRYMQLAKGRFFDEVADSWVFGPEFFCNVAFLHFGKMSAIKERLPKVIENIEKLGIKELICLHDECYSSYTSLAPALSIEVPFRPIHYYEYLFNKLKEYKSDVTQLNVRAAFQRNCSTRLIPEMGHFVDDIFKLIGVNKVVREYDGENALCCGEIFRMARGYDAVSYVRNKNIDDMVKAGAEYCVFNCTGCLDTMQDYVSDRGIKPIHMIDLCRLAIGEKP